MSHLCGVLSLPTFSKHAPRLLAKIQSEDISLKELSDCLRLDPGIGARLLHMANSPFFGVNGQVSSIEEALLVLGIRRARDLIHVQILQSMVSSQHLNKVDLSKYWKRALRVAVICQAAAKQVGYTDADAFIAGLFHNLGCLILLQGESDEYGRILNECSSTLGLLNFEEEFFQTNHADIGSNVLTQWHFPVDICDAIALQHDVPSSYNAQSTLCRLLQISVRFDEDHFPESAMQNGWFDNLGVHTWLEADFALLAGTVELNLSALANLLGE